METTVENAELVKLPIEDQHGRRYTIRFAGTRLAYAGNIEVYQTDDERFIVYDAHHLNYSEVDDPEEDLPDWLNQDEYIDVMNALGVTPEIDL